MLQCQIGFKPKANKDQSHVQLERGNQRSNILVYIGHFVLYSAFIVNTSAVGTSAFFAMSFDIVITKLTDLMVKALAQDCR